MDWKNCIFDLYGTLVDIRTDERAPVLWQQMAEEFARRGAACPAATLQDRYHALIRQAEGAPGLRQDAHEAHPEIDIEAVFRELLREQRLPASPVAVRTLALQFRRWSTRFLRLYDGAEQLLRDLRTAGKGVYLLSNAQGVFTRWELDQLGLTDAFDGICLSSEAGCKKPDPHFFRLLLERYDIDPAQAVMIGNDGVCDIGGGRALGMATIYVHSAISPREPYPAADHILDPLDLKKVRQILLEA